MATVEERLARYYKAQKDIKQTLKGKLNNGGSGLQKYASSSAAAEKPAGDESSGSGGGTPGTAGKSMPSLAEPASPQINLSPPPSREPHAGASVGTPPGVPQPAKDRQDAGTKAPPAGSPPRPKPQKPATTSYSPPPERVSAGRNDGKRKEPKGDVVLVMTVEIAEGLSDAIEIHEGDKPSALAEEFCAKNKLPDRVVGPLTSHIEGNLARVMQQRSAQSTPEKRRPSRPGSAAARSKARDQAKAKPQRPRPASAHPRDPGAEPIHERLHKQAREKKEKLKATLAQEEAKKKKDHLKKKQGMSWVSQQMTLGRNTGEYENYGERLYVEGILNKEKKLELEMRHKKDEEKKLKKSLRSRPEISTAPASMEFHKSHGNRKAIWSRLYEPAFQHKNTKVEMMRREKEMQEMEECTFKPKISQRSKQIVGQRTRALNQHGIPLHEQLYQEAEQRQRRLDRYACWFPDHVTFRPTVSGAKIDDSDYTDVVDRLYARKEQSRRRLHYLKEELERPVDHETGQGWFQPKIGRKPQFERNLAKLPIGNYLYGMRYEFDDKKEFLHEMDEQIRDEMVNQVFTTNRSEKLTERMKQRRFKEIFALLDKDGNGVIDFDEMKHLPEYERFSNEIQMDLLFAMESTGEFKDDIDLETFTYLMEHAVEMNVCYRHYLQPDIRVVDPHPEETYHPKINSYSQKLAKKRREREGYPVFESLYRDQVLNKEHIEQMRLELDEERMKECTFQPKLNFSSQSTPSKAYHSFEKGETFHLQNLDYGDESFVDDGEEPLEDVTVG